jgi:hypothetical protein
MDSVLNERWFALSLVEQMINIGNEVKRVVRSDSIGSISVSPRSVHILLRVLKIKTRSY